MAEVRAGRLFSISKIKDNVDLSSQIGAGNKVFTLPSNYLTGHVKLYLNSLKQEVGVGKDFEETGPAEVTFTVAPEAGDSLIADYIED